MKNVLFRTLALCAFALFLGHHPATAHDGPHRPKLLVKVAAATVHDKTVLVQLDMTNLGSALQLQGVDVATAANVRFEPLQMDFADDGSTQVTIQFTAEVPVKFVANLDFGVGGQGPIMVTPVFPNAAKR